MNDLLLTVLSLSFSGSLVAAALFLLKPLLKNRLSKTWQYYLWLLVIARMLLPFSPEASPAGRLFEQAAPPPVRQETPLQAGERADSPAPDVPSAPAPAGPGAPEQGFSLSSAWRLAYPYLWIVWLAGALFLLTKKVVSYQSFLRFIKAGRREVTDPGIRDIYLTAAAELDVPRLPRLYTHPMAGIPMQIGVLRPCVILPERIEADEALSYTLRHELTHCRRLETLYKWAVQLTVCVHWFNPVMYAVAREVDRACELACDEAVMRRLDREEQRAYGSLLLSSAAAAGYSSEVVSVALCEDGKHLKERLSAILEFGKRKKLWVGAGAALTALLFLGAGYLGAYTAAKTVLMSIAPPILGTLPGDAITPGRHTDSHHYGWDYDDYYDDYYDDREDFSEKMSFGGLTNNGYEYTGAVEMRTQVDQTLSMEGVKRLAFELNSSDVEILPAGDQNIRLVCDAEWAMTANEKPALVLDGDTLTLDTKSLPLPYVTQTFGNTTVRNSLKRKITLYLPAGYEHALTAELNSSDITAKLALRLSSCDVTANASDVTLKELSCGAFALRMNASDLIAGRLTGAGKVQVNASDAVLSHMSLTGPVELKNNSGSLLVEYEKGAGFALESRWTFSEFLTGFRMEREEDRYNKDSGRGEVSVNGGGPLLNVRTNCGDTEIRECK